MTEIFTLVQAEVFRHTRFFGYNPAGRKYLGLSSGNYTVTITDANACVLTQTFTLTEPTPLHVVKISAALHHGYNISCNGGDDGSISLSVAGGVSPYTFVEFGRYNSEYRYPESRNIYSANSWCKQCINNPLHYSYSTWTGVIWFGSDRVWKWKKTLPVTIVLMVM